MKTLEVSEDDDLFFNIVNLCIAAVGTEYAGDDIKDRNKHVFKHVRKIQRESTCPTTRRVMEQLAQSRNNCAEAVKATYEILVQNASRDWVSDCGCKFESDNSNTVILCDECAKLPCHNRGCNER